MQKYEKLEKIGEGISIILISFFNLGLCNIITNIFMMFMFLLTGTYGTVFKAKNRENQEIVALKRVRLVSKLLFDNSYIHSNLSF